MPAQAVRPGIPSIESANEGLLNACGTRQAPREVITEHLPTTLTTDQRSDRPLRIVTFTNAGNRLPGDHVAGIDTVSHMVAGDH